MNRFLKIFYNIAIIYILFIISWYMPFSYKLANSSIFLKLDFFLIYIIIQALIWNRFDIILFGFIIGFLMDLDMESNLIGLNSFFIPIVSYFLGFLKLNSSNWNIKFKFIYLSIIVFIYFCFKFIFYQWHLNFLDFISIIMNSILVIGCFISINKYFYKNKLIK